MHDLDTAQARARKWLFEEAAPFWASRGVHSDGMFVEAFSPSGEIIDDVRRLRVQARQIYSFCEIGRLGWDGPWREVVARALVPFIERGLTERKWFINAFDQKAQPSDLRPDLYSQAFGLFALAHAGEMLQRQDLLDLAVDVLDSLEEHWSRPQGGFWEGEITPCPPFRQNPHMHIFEAALSHYRITGSPRWRDLATRVSTIFRTRFQDSSTGAVTEYFDENWRPLPTADGRIVEPGHCLEWAWLFEVAFEPVRDIDTAELLLGFARKHGICPHRNVAINEVSLDGTVVDGRARLWPQTERIKSAVARHRRTAAEDDRREIIDAWIGLERYFAGKPAGLWHDKIDEQGTPIEEPSPASSFYHIVCGLSELLPA